MALARSVVGAAAGCLLAVVGWGPRSVEGDPRPAPDEVRFVEVTLAGRAACACLAPGTDLSAIGPLEGLIGHPGANPNGYATTSRWDTSASGGGGALGSPITLTYSFVADGTIPSEGGTLTNTLHASFDAKFGSTEAWKDIFRESFAAWGALTGVTYVEETADDGATWPESPGVLGVRGDIRIVAQPIDGTSGVLAFNYFPSYGDMALDVAEPWQDSSGDYRFLRNTLMHEMGHGIGLLHVWPLDASKLMEPFLNENFAGPQDDDVRGGQALYDDTGAGNGEMETARDLGMYSDGMMVGDLGLRNGSQEDWYWLAASPGDRFSVTVTPIGSTYQTGPSSGSTPTVNTRSQLPLSVTIHDADGDVLRLASGSPGAPVETVPLLVSGGACGVFVRVFSATAGGDVQRYELRADASTDPLFNLNVQAVNGDGISATVQPADATGTSGVDLTTGGGLLYPGGTAITLTAPVGPPSFAFTRWVINGVASPEGQRAVTFTIGAETTAIAQYGEIFDALISGNRSLVEGESTQLTVTASGGEPPYTFSWSPPEVVSSPTSPTTQATPLAGTSLAVTVRDMSGTEIVRPVTFDFVPPLTLDVSENQSVVIGRFPLLQAEASGGTLPYRYAWSPVAENTDPTQPNYAPQVLEPGGVDYSVTVTDGAGRQITRSVRVAAIEVLDLELPDEVFAIEGVPIKLRAEVLGGQAPYEINWFAGNKPIFADGAELTLTPTETQLYLANVRDAVGQTAARIVRVAVARPLRVEATAARLEIKPGDSVVLDTLIEGGTPPIDFSWDPPLRLSDPVGKSTMAFPERSTVYTVTATDARGQVATDTVRLTVDAGFAQPLEDPLAPAVVDTDDFVPVTPVAACGFGLASFAPLTALALVPLRRRRG